MSLFKNMIWFAECRHKKYCHNWQRNLIFVHEIIYHFLSY